ncbi:M20 family peptidase [Algoriphagus zhangzhouensis]|uniref:Carboxypeptidase PM20D1 n=1 Tax=Algoriphagus zhangzhouensis TaxID=1073327 RepID=A0A1M7Z573_9BACT|nr:M20 family peptidase [Algoriphagus zhangzhouensis]TDY48829.1 carboxypeptidase PM20D1 [Algoriphagus zhangzhouensis]SHO60019.1 carboxypeptidase PM20D1 [Algoriphagus zhangzhouensis]
MKIIGKLLLGLLGLIVILVAILLFNTFRVSSKQVEPDPIDPIAISDSAFVHLSGAIQFPTISFNEDTPPDSAIFNGFHRFLEATFPKVHQTMELTKINEYSLLYTWKGSDSNQKPIILMSHQDVVPVDEPTLGQWEAPPFEGRITADHIIGRGTLDDKSSLIALLESAEMLIGEGFVPKQTIYFAFGHDEEVGGPKGASKIAEYLEKKGVEAAFTLDEGGMIAEGMIPGVDKPVSMINVAEKGFASFRLIVETQGGHSSSPPKENTIGMLAQAIVDLENNQLPYRLVEPVEYQLEYLGPELPFLQKMAFANPWLLKGPILEALNSHTSTAPTIIDGGFKNNVIPTVAEATINFRILPGETIESVQEHIQSTINEKVRVEPVGFLTNPSPSSSIELDAFKKLEKTIRSVFPNSVVMPGLIAGGTDARYFYGISEGVYRFYPIRISPEGMTRFHGIDEKISKENYKEMIQFTYQLMKRFNED